PYPSSVQIGETSAADFDFPWGPHAPKLLPNGNILVFDNGTYRNFNDDNRYSRVVEYEIDDTNKTVRQVWQYGKERGEEFYSSIVSDADYLPGTENILVTSGYILPQSNHSGKIVEVNRKTGEEVFEATLYFKTLNGDKTVAGWGQTDILYRSERMPLKK
ncbi:MAG: aryl-sulfate sulfotransferase, partial [Flavobacteriaceae bacterium]|nr:aryl-sulfate sulfotransferase [Flavobacteriaceae bacterium]